VTYTEACGPFCLNYMKRNSSAQMRRRRDHISLYIYIYIYTRIQTHTYTHIHTYIHTYIHISSSSSSSIGTTAHCGLWPVEQYPSIFPYLSPILSIFSLPALEGLFLLPLSIRSWVFLFVSSLSVLG